MSFLAYFSCRPTDEIGHLPLSEDGGRLFFQLVRARHERGTMVLTTNKGFEEWGAVLGDEVMATAMLDRLLHRCHVVNIQGASYRMREYQAMRRASNPISGDDAEPSSEVDKSGTF